ncbi:cytochrome b/b6 domain-containing protein [Terriglobus albidus]|uniref:cytochrome b/b6 domain-containing protein n=1 Tax=Terriglobus albidus TaxID=1592106 RepID=UPI001FE3DF08|nr:cytochrome b/b6 domain-containing protein [Terriglobus albidus]
MTPCYAPVVPTTVAAPATERSRHSAVVRVTHWITVFCFLALLVTGVEILLSHPRFYWGETGNVNMHPLFTLHVPSSRAMVPTGYAVLPDQNGWSRYLHFEAAWLIILTGIVYVLASLWNGHLRRDLLPAREQRNWKAYAAVLGRYLHRAPVKESGAYNAVQRAAYLGVIFGLLPLLIWTGLALSPAVASVAPWAVEALGGRQSARTLHFFATVALVLFFVVHVVMVTLAGFWSRTRAMVTGVVKEEQL